MGTEIERKFLVQNNAWRKGACGKNYTQGYIAAQGCSVRVRLSGAEAWLTLKTRESKMTRLEFEYPIPAGDARILLERFCSKPLIEKTRYRIEHQGMIWEIDEFAGENNGLIVAEIELEHEDQPFDCPSWLGREVTHDSRYLNASLVQNPYIKWKNEEFM